MSGEPGEGPTPPVDNNPVEQPRENIRTLAQEVRHTRIPSKFKRRALSLTKKLDGTQTQLAEATNQLEETTKQKNEALRTAETDPVTHGHNRNFYEREILERIDLMRRFNIGFAEIVMDLNGTKWVNDRLGHLRGDDYIRAANRVIKKRIRGGDFIARIGGDEFVVILVGANEQGVREFWEKINTEFVKPRKNIGVAAGVSFATPEMLSSPQSHRGLVDSGTENTEVKKKIFEQADEALAKAKTKGSRYKSPDVTENRIVFHTELAA